MTIYILNKFFSINLISMKTRAPEIVGSFVPGSFHDHSLGGDLMLDQLDTENRYACGPKPSSLFSKIAYV